MSGRCALESSRGSTAPMHLVSTPPPQHVRMMAMYGLPLPNKAQLDSVCKLCADWFVLCSPVSYTRSPSVQPRSHLRLGSHMPTRPFVSPDIVLWSYSQA